MARVFDPVEYSIEENEFLLENLGKPPIVAEKLIRFPVNPNAVLPALAEVYALQEQEKHEGIAWIGLTPVREKIQIYIDSCRKWASDKRKGAPRFPTMSAVDHNGRAHWSGPGSDSGRVRTYFTPSGERVPFALNLTPEGTAAWSPDWVTPQAVRVGIANNTEATRIECLTCGHTESYKVESRSSYNAARARMSKHLRKATDNADAHREAHTNEFGS